MLSVKELLKKPYFIDLFSYDATHEILCDMPMNQ